MNLKESISKVGWNLSGNIIYAMCQWFIISILTYFGTQSDLGKYTLALAISAPIVMFFLLQLRGVLATDDFEDYNFFKYSGARTIHMLFAVIALIIYSLVYKGFSEIAILTILVGLNKIIEGQSDIYLGGLQKEERTDIVGISQLLRGILQLLIFGGSYILYRNLLLSSLLMILVSVYRLIFFDKKKLLEITGNAKPDYSQWKQLFILGLPLGLVSLLNSLNTNIPKYFLDNILDVKFVGIFSAFFYFLTAASLVFDPIIQVLGPQFGKLLNQNKMNDFESLINKIVIIFSGLIFLGTIAIFFLKEIIVGLIYSTAYVQYSDLLLYMMPSIYFTGLILLYNLAAIATRNIASQPIYNFFTLIFSIFTSYFLITYFGIVGAFIALSLNRCFQFCMSYLVYRKGLKKFDKNWQKKIEK